MKGSAARGSGRIVALLLVVMGVTAASPIAEAQEDPTAPTGRAVCNVAFTAVAAVSFGSYSVPAGAPLGPNDVLAALTPVLRTCLDLYPYPAATPRVCLTSDALPSTGLPVTPPDPVGIATEQAEAAIAVVGDPVSVALAGPLHGFFVDALACRDPSGTADDTGGVAPEPGPPTTAAPSRTVAPAQPGVVAPATSSTSVAAAPPAAGAVISVEAAPAPASSGGGAPFDSVLASVPAPLRGRGAVLCGLFLACLAVVLRRQLSPSRVGSLLDVATGP